MVQKPKQKCNVCENWDALYKQCGQVAAVDYGAARSEYEQKQGKGKGKEQKGNYFKGRGKGNITCFLRGEAGHIVRQCPLKTRVVGDKCGVCGGVGHAAGVCPSGSA